MGLTGLTEEVRRDDLALRTRPCGSADSTSIASVVAFLASDEGHWVNGQVIRADDQ